MSASIQAIVISGSMGSGKTTIMGEAAIDLDALGIGHLPERVRSDLPATRRPP